MLGLPFATDGARIAVLLVRLGALPYGHADGRLSVPGAGLVSAVTHYGDPSTVLAPGRSWRSTCARGRSCSPETTSGRGSRSASWRSPPCWAKPSGRAVVWFEASCRCTRSPSPRSSVGCGPAGRRPRGNQREGRLGTTPRRPAFRSYSCLGEERERARRCTAQVPGSGSRPPRPVASADGAELSAQLGDLVA